MKKIIFLCLLAFKIGVFADSFVLENQTAYPTKKSKIAIQWAHSAQEVENENQAILHRNALNKERLEMISQSGQIDITIPKKATYFRIVAWSKGQSEPDFVTNWVDIAPNKTYTLETDHLIPSVLMAGMGC